MDINIFIQWHILCLGRLWFPVTKFCPPLPPPPPPQKKKTKQNKNKRKKERKQIVENRRKKLSKCERALGTTRRECSVRYRTKSLTTKMIVATKELTHKVQHLINCKEHFISVINTRLIFVAYGFFYSLYAFFQEKEYKKPHS